MKTPVVLVVDDEALLRMLAADFFADAGYEVLEAANGMEAEALLATRPDIAAVFTDVQMPGRPDGFELSRRVRELNPTTAIVVVSGRVAPVDGDLASGARYVTKPYKGREIVGLVSDMLGRSDSNRTGPAGSGADDAGPVLTDRTPYDWLRG